MREGAEIGGPRRSGRGRGRPALPWRVGAWIAYGLAGCVGAAAVLLVTGNVLLSTTRNVPYRALDPRAEICMRDAEAGWNILGSTIGSPPRAVANDEWAAIDLGGPETRRRLSCAIQRHALTGPAAPGGPARRLTYDLAFVELQEDGKPYILREPCDAGSDGCQDEAGAPVRKIRGSASQLQAILDRLDPKRPNYVIAFVHGWRHDAEIGDSNVGDFRHYAAHVARFLDDRFADDPEHRPTLTAVYIGWRGARTDETWAKRHFGQAGEWIASLSALPTLFDRKPVSEAVAPAALSALRAIERKLGIDAALPAPDALPAPGLGRMIVFGHSLGGNMLITALEDDLAKKVSLHVPGRYMQPTVGDLVVLINPAAEASKWITVQRAVWNRIPMSRAERAQPVEYARGHDFFRPEQRPILLSVTAALDWPPGGRTEADCAPSAPVGGAALGDSRALVGEGVDYDWATHDMFPAFKGDFRPIADSLVRWSSGRDPHDQCLGSVGLTPSQRIFGWIGAGVARTLRVLPFMRTDPEETRTIGHLDPARAARGGLANYVFPTRPFGTTHELRGLAPGGGAPLRKMRIPDGALRAREIPVDYVEVAGPEAACPRATGWLTAARDRQQAADPSGHGTYWASDAAGVVAPALQFVHGFNLAGIAAITRARDPFWNMRAFDTALARHDGYMLSSFICAMNQLVMDDVTTFPPAPGPAPRPTP